MLEKELLPPKETLLNVRGHVVKFIEFEADPDGDFVKICAYDHDLGVASEYAWLKNKYPNDSCIRQSFSQIFLNGKKIKCDILTIKNSGNEIKNIYFDISQMMEDLNNKVSKKTNIVFEK
jgi:hypothetical protein